jgi:hypothetical protein
MVIHVLDSTKPLRDIEMAGRNDLLPQLGSKSRSHFPGFHLGFAKTNEIATGLYLKGYFSVARG